MVLAPVSSGQQQPGQPANQVAQVNGTGPLSVNAGLAISAQLVANSSPSQNYYQQQLMKQQHNFNVGIQQQAATKQQHQQIYTVQQQENQQDHQHQYTNGLFPGQQNSPANTLYAPASVLQKPAMMPPAAPFYPSPQQQQPLYQARQASIYQQQLQNGGSFTLRKMQNQQQHHLQNQHPKLSPVPNSAPIQLRASLPAENLIQEHRIQHQQPFIATAYQTPNCQPTVDNHLASLMANHQQVYHLQNNNSATSNNINNHQHQMLNVAQTQQTDLSIINNNGNHHIWPQHHDMAHNQNQQMMQRLTSEITGNNNTIQHTSIQNNSLSLQHQHQVRPISFVGQLDQQQQHRNTTMVSGRGARSSRLFSDRDSVSTLSRFDQTTIDDRRSFTMRSQCTNVNNAKRYADQLGFIKLTGEALKRLVGLSNPIRGQPLLSQSPTNLATLSDVYNQQHNKTNTNLRRNMNMTINSNSKHSATTSNFRPITVIDSAEDYYFKKRVFKYQLNILRLISFLLGALVLLSPVVMLLIPKMEFIFNQSVAASANSNEFDTAATSSQDTASRTSSQPSIKHALGLNSLKKQNSHQNQQNQQHFAPQPQWRISDCTTDCDGPLIGFVTRFLILCIAYWAVFFRTQTSSLPRIDFHRCLLVSMALLITSAYWLFFIFRVFDKRFNDFELQYLTIVHFATSMLESLILLHYLALVLLEMRKRKKIYCLKVVRSPDGVSQYYSCGALSIQQCAQYVLEKYSRHFPQYGPFTKQLLELEDELATNNKSASLIAVNDRHRSPSTRSRPISPHSGHRDRDRDRARERDPDDIERNRRTQSRSSRHHSRANSHHRSPNRSPPPSPKQSSRSQRSQKKSFASNINSRNQDNNNANLNTSQITNSVDLDHVKTMQQHDENAKIAPSSPTSISAQTADESQHVNKQNSSLSFGMKENKQAEHANDEKEKDDDISNSNNNNLNSQVNGSSNSSDQSSDATSRNNLKESSLETIRAANSSSDLLLTAKNTDSRLSDNLQQNQQQEAGSATTSNEMNTSSYSSNRNLGNNSNNNHINNSSKIGTGRSGSKIMDQDETESVRSVRSRRSTSRGHHHRHHGHHGSSSVIADHQSNSRSHHRSHANYHQDHHHDRDQLDEEQRWNPVEEHEKKLRRRKLRLLMSVHETFDQIKRIEGVEDNNHLRSSSRLNSSDSEPDQGEREERQDQESIVRRPMSAGQTSRLVYPSFARTLQKYLRLTKQTGRHNLQSIYEHLSKCLLYNLSARTFLEKFTNQDPVLQQNESNLFVNCRLSDATANIRPRQVDTFEVNSWSLVSDTLVSRQIDSGTFFVLRQGSVSLLVSVGKLSHLHLQEEVLDQKRCKFLLNAKDESSC